MLIDYAAQIKERISMMDICEKYGISVSRNHKAVCPFHADNNPSMHIYPGRRGFYCFTCGTHGDVIAFVQKYFQLPFNEALKRIDSDFKLNLGIGNPLTDEEKAEQKRAEYKRRKLRELKNEHHKELLLRSFRQHEPLGTINERFGSVFA